MNFEPDNILVPREGNNANTRTINVRVMGKFPATPTQLRELASRFEHHKIGLRNSLIGFATKDGELPDGSRFRIVSNSGQHTLVLWPAGGTKRVELVDNFWGIPSSITNVDGVGGRWSVGGSETSMPANLSFTRPRVQDASALTAHPGHITWSSPNFKADRNEIVVSWRGPRARYTASNGWTVLGGPFTQHSLSSYDYTSVLGQKVFKDSSYVWINDIKKSTPVNKIIAAAIHCPDPVGAPGRVVLRVVTDNLSNDNVTRALGAKDLVPAGATGPVTIQKLVEATSLVVLNTYTYAGEGVGPGQWRLWQRPHFNAAGDKIATFITGSQGTGPAALNATTGVVAQLVNLDGVQISGGSQTISDAGAGTAASPRVIGIGRTETSDTTNKYIVGVDFLNGALVWCWEEIRSVSNYTTREDETSGTGVPYSLVTSNSFSRDVTRSVKHSVYGTLWSSTASYPWTSSYNSTGTVGTFGGSQEGPSSQIALSADLSRDVLAFGYSVTNSVQRFAKSSSTIVNPSGDPYRRSIMVDTQKRSQPFTFDIWMKGLQRAGATTGSFVNDASALGTLVTNGDSAIVLEGTIAQYRASGLPPPVIGTNALAPVGYSVSSSNAMDTGEPVAVKSFSTYGWHQCAVNARRATAYFGIFYRDDLGSGPTLPAIDFGLEAACFLHNTVFTLGAVPAYSAGARATISAPVFPGVTRKEFTQ